MPKEITHAILAQQIVDRLSDGPLKTAATEHPPAVLLGAAFHDCGYFQLGRRSTCDLEPFSDRLHGAHGEDTFGVLRALEAPDADAGPQLRAFLVGVASHIAVDSVFHPCIDYFTGNYHHPDPHRRRLAIQAHRKLEVLLDLFVCGGLRQITRFAVRGSLRALEIPLASLMGSMASRVDAERADALAPARVRAFDDLARIQRLMMRTTIVDSLYRLVPLLPAAAGPLLALGYARCVETECERLNHVLVYRDPVTGDRHRHSIAELMKLATAKGIEICDRLDASIAGHDAVLPDCRGPLLELDVFGSDDPERCVFHPAVIDGRYEKVLSFDVLGGR